MLDKNLDNSGIKSASLMDSMGSYLFVAGAVLIVLFFAILAMVVATKKCKEKIRGKLEE